jgi:hypothetical protein
MGSAFKRECHRLISLILNSSAELCLRVWGLLLHSNCVLLFQELC